MSLCPDIGLDTRLCPCAVCYELRQHGETHSISSSPTLRVRTDWQESPGASTLPELAGQLARGDSFCPLGAVTPRFFITSHSAANTH